MLVGQHRDLGELAVSDSARSPPPGICRWRERLASKALLGEPFGEVAAYSRLRGFAAKEDITDQQTCSSTSCSLLFGFRPGKK
jgi:hypothetical protein